MFDDVLAKAVEGDDGMVEQKTEGVEKKEPHMKAVDVVENSKRSNSIAEYVKNTLNSIEKDIVAQSSPKGSVFKVSDKKPKYNDIYCGVTWSVRRRVNELVDYISETSGANKYEIIDMIVLSGLKNIDFGD